MKQRPLKQPSPRPRWDRGYLGVWSSSLGVLGPSLVKGCHRESHVLSLVIFVTKQALLERTLYIASKRTDERVSRSNIRSPTVGLQTVGPQTVGPQV